MLCLIQKFAWLTGDTDAIVEDSGIERMALTNRGGYARDDYEDDEEYAPDDGCKAWAPKDASTVEMKKLSGVRVI